MYTKFLNSLTGKRKKYIEKAKTFFMLIRFLLVFTGMRKRRGSEAFIGI